MGLLKWLIGYEAANHLLKASCPQPVNIRLHVALPEEEEDEEGQEHTEKYGEDDRDDLCPGDGIYVRDDNWGHTRFYDRNGRETDKNGIPR